MMELVALDLWDVARIKLKGEQDDDIRCAIADFGVKGGMAQTNAFVFDTTVTNVTGSGTINLKTEEMDLKLKPRPKDRGVGSLRTPLHIKGTFAKPEIGPDMGKLAARGGGAVALGILNPLLAILPLIEEGKGRDSPCAELIAQAASSSKAATSAGSPSSTRSPASGATAPRPPSQSKR
jgi:AsmA protein